MSVLAMINFSTSFDTTDQSLLVCRLNADFGSTDTVLQWISSYLTDWTQCVFLSNYYSVFIPANSGNGHASVLGTIQCKLSLFMPLLIHTLSRTIHLLKTYNYRCVFPLTKDQSCFTLLSHVYLMSKLGQLRTCFDLMISRKISCLLRQNRLTISITYLLQSLLIMLEFHSDNL